MRNKFFDSFFDNTIEGMLIIENGFIKDINNSMLDILKYESKNDIIDKLATGILIPNINQNYLQYNNTMYEEVSLISKEGNLVPAIIKIKDFEEDGKFYKMVFVLNLTELKQKESLLIEQSRMAAMGEMISLIAHQWRQPLSTIATAISSLKFRIEINKLDNETLNTKLMDIDKYIHYMSETINDFRNFFKSDKEKELITLDYIVNIALEMLGNSLSFVKINQPKTELQKINIFKNELLQVILNILNNSIDAFKENKIEKPEISINYENLEHEQIIIIKDNAGGIPPFIIDKIFDPYFTTKDKRNGTGLGLYMCTTIVEKHFKGSITVSSHNKETEFKIRINKYL